MDVAELMKEVGQIRLVTSRLMDEHLVGDYHSVFKGQGIEFDEVREYTPGDDIRSIDWNVTARMAHPYVKRYAEERELTVMFLVDASGSMRFGSSAQSKAALAARLTCLLALSAIRNQDKVGLILFSSRIRKFISPRKGRTAVMRLVREVLAAEDTAERTDIAGALRFFNNVQKRKAIVFLVSDFLDGAFIPELRVTARKHDVIACRITDPREEMLTPAGLLEAEDPETGELFLLDTSPAQVRHVYAENAALRTQQLQSSFRKLKMDHLSLATDRPYADEIRKFFRLRQRRAARGGRT